MAILGNNPVLVIGGAVGILLVIGVIVMFFVAPKKKYIDALILDRNDSFDFLKCESVAGIACYRDGGFDIDNQAVIPYVFGGSKLELGLEENRKQTKPIFINRIGDTGAVRISDEGFKSFPMNLTEFERRENLAAEIARNNAEKKINSIDLINVSLVAVMILLAIPLAAIGLNIANG